MIAFFSHHNRHDNPPLAYCSDPAVCHALKVHEAMLTENLHAFFKLYPHTPNMGLCILDMMVDSVRIKALQRMNRGYKVSLEVSFVLDEIAFEVGKDDQGKVGKMSIDDLLKLVQIHTPLVEKKKEDEKKDEKEEKKKKKNSKKKVEKLEQQIGHHILAKRHSDHDIEHVLQSNLFAGLQFLYKAGCKMTVENNVLMWDTKNLTIRSSMEVLGEEKLLL
ncbi:hypothetical protein EON65_38825 [archaeon]|nr:MAG: hypothetical protein EON65_38825 [archaeon]